MFSGGVGQSHLPLNPSLQKYNSFELVSTARLAKFGKEKPILTNILSFFPGELSHRLYLHVIHIERYYSLQLIK